MNHKQLRNIFKKIFNADGYDVGIGMCANKLHESFNFLNFKNNLRDFDYKKLCLYLDDNGVLVLYRPAEFWNPYQLLRNTWEYFSGMAKKDQSKARAIWGGEVLSCGIFVDIFFLWFFCSHL